MKVLALRLAAPLQSWGVRSRLARRSTGAAPTKSGVVGLLAAADGRRRSDPIEDLCRLRFAVRIDQPGRLVWDYQTVSRASAEQGARRMPTAGGGTRAEGEPQVTRRAYLEDAVFVAAVQGDSSLIEALAAAIRAPRFPLYLGRRSCPPVPPLLLGVSNEDIETVLASLAWQGNGRTARLPGDTKAIELEVVIDDEAGDPEEADFPLSFDPRNRSFGARRVRRYAVTVPVERKGADARAHDPFQLL